MSLKAGQAPESIPIDHIYFTFGSGRLDYDCIQCGAHCCRGHGYQLQAGRELQAHIATSSAVRFFFDRCDAEKSDHYHVKNWTPGCFFLTDAGQCGIQLQHGYDAKPETCRLFPFNQISRVGDYMIIAPHSGLCPLGVVAHGRVSPRSGHAELLGLLRGRTLNNEVGDAAGCVRDTARLIALERRIVALSEEHLCDPDYTRFATAQIAATAAVFGVDAESAHNTPTSDTVHAFRVTLHQVLGATTTSSDPQALSYLTPLIASTPSLRAQALFRRRGHLPFIASTLLARLPFALLALDVLARLAQDAGMRRVTFQTLMKVFIEYQALIALLAHLDEVIAWRPEAKIELQFPGDNGWRLRYLDIVRALLPQTQLKMRAPLARILLAHLPPAHLERATFLKRLAQRLAGQVMPAGKFERVSIIARYHSPRAWLQQLVLGHLNSHTIARIAEQRSMPVANGRAH